MTKQKSSKIFRIIVEILLFHELNIANNIEIEELKDITKDKDKNLEKVVSITIDKSPKFSKGDWVDSSAEIKITYHDKK